MDEPATDWLPWPNDAPCDALMDVKVFDRMVACLIVMSCRFAVPPVELNISSPMPQPQQAPVPTSQREPSMSSSTKSCRL